MTGPTKDNFTLLKGGKLDREQWPRHFVSAYVTDTRLMGSLGLYVHWHAAWQDEGAHFHQFFYVETEEAGLETYFSLWSDDPEEVARLEKENIGGLGGQKVDLSLAELKQILKYYADFNAEHNLPLPDRREEYRSLIETATALTPKQAQLLLAKQCTPITSPYQGINYFLMRAFGQDLDAAALLCDPYLEEEVDGKLQVPALYPQAGIATLCQSNLTLVEEWTESAALYDDYDHAMPTTGSRYLANVLIEHDSLYENLVVSLSLSRNIITAYKVQSHMEVSPAEAALILARPEFISVYQILADEMLEGYDVFTLDFDSMTEVYEYGRLFFSFYDNNAHVDSLDFRLSGDVRNVYYLTDFGQLLVMAYDRNTIYRVEQELAKGSMMDKLLLTDRYEFKEPVLYEFIQSGFEDFNEFVEVIRED